MRYVLLLAVAMSAGCSTALKDDASTPVHIVWQKVDDVQKACEEVSGKRELFRVLGCSKWRDVDGQRTCTIYSQAPRDERDLQRFATLGHELMHCTDGNWHDRWGRMSDEKVRQAKAADRTASAAAETAAAGGSKRELE